MANWKLELDIDCGDDEETESVVDDIVWQGASTIREALEALQVVLKTGMLRVVDPHGNVYNITSQQTGYKLR